MSVDESGDLTRMREFIATLLRELRNPLAPLRYALGVLQTQTPVDPATTRARTVMERQVDNLVRLVDDLLEVSRVSSGAFELRRQAVDLASVVASAVDACQPQLRASEHAFEVRLPERPIWLEGDPGRLARILVSLLDNAVRYTERGGRVAVLAVADGASVRISVRDSGRGFAPEVGERLFDVFKKSERSAGLGLGLALARGLAEMHGGSITASSEGEGRGAEFVVTLPMVLDHSAAAPVRCRVLIADDNRDAADTLAFILRDLGAEVAVTYNGAEAVEAARAFAPDLALLDIGMPVLDGYAAATRIRGDAGTRRLTLVALTGWGQADDVKRAREAGFDEHLVKPATFEALHALLASATR